MSKPKAYYNEIDPFCVEWLRNLIKAGLIADGVVDNRSIVDVTPSDLKEFTQCHFFAGIGVWSYALRRAGWRDDRQVWTGSCPCQPFSAAGKGAGFDDERHLWPSFYWLIGECRPTTVFGEQVASSDGLEWIDLVQSDLEGAQYAFAATDFCSAGVGAPHIRQRLYFVAQSLDGLADTNNNEYRRAQRERDAVESGEATRDRSNLIITRQFSGASESLLLGVGHADDSRLERLGGGHQTARGESGSIRPTTTTSELSGVADADDFIAELLGEDCGSAGPIERQDLIRYGDLIGLGDSKLHGPHEVEQPRRANEERGLQQPQGSSDALIGLADTGSGRFQEARRGSLGRVGESGISEESRPPYPTNGFWGSADWLFCRDGKFRPVEPVAIKVAYGSAAGVVSVRTAIDQQESKK